MGVAEQGDARRAANSPARRWGLALLISTGLLLVTVGPAWLGPQVGAFVNVGLAFAVAGMLAAVSFLIWAVIRVDDRGEGSRFLGVPLGVGVLASIASAAVIHTSADSWALKTRGKWTEATVVKFQPHERYTTSTGKSVTLKQTCKLVTAEGQPIRPRLTEPRGCVGLGEGSRVRVLHDPSGTVRPRADEPPMYTAAVLGLSGTALLANTVALVAMRGSAPGGGAPRLRR
ncbi:hypothetical protein [Streptomyces sp. AJS327]|uniref:hypothetical protein n=1 Tax=Streptomyces sp. AJS327 TaxID=2545265 RepID=UPI0015DFF614|nr:hypothetical protein [Streptomyces sp. AJS327]